MPESLTSGGARRLADRASAPVRLAHSQASAPAAPSLDELEALVRRQQAEIAGLRSWLAALRARQDIGGEGAAADPWRGRLARSFARLRALRRAKRPRAPAWPRLWPRLAAPLARGVEWLVARERERLLRSCPDRSRAPPERLEALGLDEPYAWISAQADRRFLARWKSAGDDRGGAQDRAGGQLDPKISVVLPVYKVSPAVLKATLESLRRQTYRNWEACIALADPEGHEVLRLLAGYARRDPRFKLTVLAANFGIAGNSNAALELATGDYVALLDHDDELPAPALARVVEAIRAAPQADFLYTDKELLSEDGARRYGPLFKPQWSPEMLYSVNYLTHLNVVRRDLMDRIGGWSLGVDGAQDWDLFLKATERADCIVRVEGVGYSWRVHPASTASSLDAKPYALHAQLRALQRHASRTGLPGRFEHHETSYRITWDTVEPFNVVVLGGRTLDLLPRPLADLCKENEDIANVHLLLGGSDTDRFEAQSGRFGEGSTARLRLVRLDEEAPLACVRNLLDQLDARVTVFLDGDGLVYTPGGLRQLAGWLRPDSAIAFASGVAVYDGDVVVEAGCVTDEAGVVHPLFRGEHLLHWGPLGGPLWRRNVDVASPYLLAVRTAEAAEALGQACGGLQAGFHAVCRTLVALRPDARGLVEPSARVMLASGGGYTPPIQGSVGACGRYFHPSLAITSAGKIVLAETTSDVA